MDSVHCRHKALVYKHLISILLARSVKKRPLFTNVGPCFFLVNIFYRLKSFEEAKWIVNVVNS